MADVPSYLQAAPLESSDLLYLARPTGTTQAERNLKTTFSLLQAAMDTALIPAGRTPIGYLAASDDILAHLDGIDAALQAVGGAINPDALTLAYVPVNYTLPGGNTTLGGGHLPGIDNALGALETEDGNLDTRITALETAPAQDATDTPYTPAVLTDWDGDADPGDVDEALDQLADRVETLEQGGAGGPGSVVLHRWGTSGPEVTHDPSSLGVTIAHTFVSDVHTTTITLPAGNWLIEQVVQELNVAESPAPAFSNVDSGFSDIGTGKSLFSKAFKNGSGVVTLVFEESASNPGFLHTKVTKLP